MVRPHTKVSPVRLFFSIHHFFVHMHDCYSISIFYYYTNESLQYPYVYVAEFGSCACNRLWYGLREGGLPGMSMNCQYCTCLREYHTVVCSGVKE